MKDAMDIVDCASDLPCASVSTTAKSFASRTSTENEVRMNAVEASSTMLTSRFHWISSAIASSLGDLDDCLRARRRETGFCLSARVRVDRRGMSELLDQNRDGVVGQYSHVGRNRNHERRFALFEH